MSKYTTPTKRDYVTSIVYISLYVATLGGGAFLLLPRYWYVWAFIVVVGLLLLVNWHKGATIYKCPNCEHVYEISFLVDFFSPHGVTRDGGWLLLRCPNCRQWRKTPVLKREE